MKNVMTKAWEIARRAYRKHGGKVSEYFAQALRMAWAMVKEENKVGFNVVAKQNLRHYLTVDADAKVEGFWNGGKSYEFEKKSRAREKATGKEVLCLIAGFSCHTIVVTKGNNRVVFKQESKGLLEVVV